MRYAFYGPVLADEPDLCAFQAAHGHSIGLWPRQPWRPTAYVQGRWPLDRLVRALAGPALARPPRPPLPLYFVVLERQAYDPPFARALQGKLRTYYPDLLVELGDVRGAQGPPAPREGWILPDRL